MNSLARPILAPIRRLGHATLDTVELIGGIGFVLYDVTAAIPRSLFHKRGRRLGWRNLWEQMVRLGVRSVPIVSLVVFCIGSILALQMAPVLKEYGATPKVADIIAIAIFRELGPLISAIVLTGFAGASIAAELGSMAVSEEIEALEAEAINPIRFLIVPRVVATAVMMVCLAVVGDVMGVFGGMIVSKLALGVSITQYLHHTADELVLSDFFSGLLKASVFGTTIASLACYLGLNVSGGAQGVGIATTRTVVLTIVALIFIDLMFTAVFYYVNI